jgi:hypothetical protein
VTAFDDELELAVTDCGTGSRRRGGGAQIRHCLSNVTPSTTRPTVTKVTSSDNHVFLSFAQAVSAALSPDFRRDTSASACPRGWMRAERGYKIITAPRILSAGQRQI